MTKQASLIVALILLAVVAYLGLYTVHQTNQALVLPGGSPVLDGKSKPIVVPLPALLVNWTGATDDELYATHVVQPPKLMVVIREMTSLEDPEFVTLYKNKR